MIQRLLLIACAILMIACHDKPSPMEEGNAVYYWRTDLQLDSLERAFLKQYHINKVYCRYFDVVMNDSLGPMPNATITFSDTLPEGIELIPTVFIVENCMHQKPERLAEKIVQRILQMNETNDIKGVKEIQIDCDYTAKSRKNYYDFLTTLNAKLSTLNIKLSTTIRLHQLSMKAPPVDYGVLMLYNTGHPMKFMERNPILDIRDVAPYLRYLEDYDLPLAAAYPVFLWHRIIQGVDIEHVATAEEILKVKTAVEKERPELRRLILTYDLANDNINRYKTETYEKIYSH
ncbi:MAG: hypothetical protein IJV17_02365 [Prevotella sp.]|nr:hypothetical protein [Prevotella sp.]MBQ9216272.1 hypothetical protein [Prevotella sp.]